MDYISHSDRICRAPASLDSGPRLYYTAICSIVHYTVMRSAQREVASRVDSFSSWVTQLRKGVVELLVLRLLAARGPLHGYAIARDLQEIGETVAGESTVYPVLKRLEAEGLVEGSWSAEGDTPPRKYYVVTAAGDAFVIKAAEQWRALNEAMRVLEEEA